MYVFKGTKYLLGTFLGTWQSTKEFRLETFWSTQIPNKILPPGTYLPKSGTFQSTKYLKITWVYKYMN